MDKRQMENVSMDTVESSNRVYSFMFAFIPRLITIFDFISKVSIRFPLCPNYHQVLYEIGKYREKTVET